MTAYLHRQGISVIPYLDDWLIHHLDRQVLLRHQALLLDTLDLVGFILNRKKSEIDLTQDIQFLGIHLRLDLGKALLSESKAWEIVARARHLSSLEVLDYTQVSQLLGSLNWASGLIPLGRLYLRPLQRHFSSLGLTDRFTPPHLGPCQLGPCQPTSAMAGPTFSYLRNPDPRISGGLYDFHGRLQSGLGRPHGGFQDFGYLDPYRPQAPHQLCGVQGGYLCPTALGSSASGPPGHDRHGQFDGSFIYQQAGGTRSPTLLRLTVDLFLWLESQSIVVPARHIPGCLNVIADHLSRPNQPIPTEWSLHPKIMSRIFRVDMFATLSNSHLPRFMSPVLEPRALAVDALSQDWQGWSMYMFPPFPLLNKVIQKIRSTQVAEVILVAPLVAVPVVVSTSATSLCGTPSGSPLPSGSSVPAGPEVHLRRKVVPSARMEALMQHYKAAGFSDEVSRLAAAPKRPSTNRMYDDRWRHFTRWAAGQGFDPLDPTAAQIASFLFDLFDTHGLSPQTIKGYRTCIGSVLNRIGRAKVVLHRTISDMIASVELQRPRITPVLPQWDLGVVLEALNKSP